MVGPLESVLMLKMMRENLKSLSWVLAAVVASFIFAVFAEYGGQGAWWGGSGTPAGDWAAKVDGTAIPTQDFLRAAQNLDGYYRNLLGASYDRQTMNLNVGQQAINQLVQEEVILAHARSLGLVATEDEIRQELLRDPALQQDGVFIGTQRYKMVLEASGLDPQVYEQDLARRILRRKWAELLTADIEVSDQQVEQEIRRRDETADILYARFRPEDYADGVKVAAAEVEAYYQQNQDRYRRGEGRVFDLVLFDRLREQNALKVPEAEARAEYDASLVTRFTIPEQRRASHILVKTPEGSSEADYQAARARAEAALARVRAGEEFAEVARQVSEDTSASNGGDLGFFQKGVMAIPFEQAVWELREVGDLSDIVQTQFGYHVIQLTGKQEARVKPFEEVREELSRDLAFRKSGDVTREKAEAFVDAVKTAPDSFRDQAARATQVVTPTGIVYPGEPIPGYGPDPELQRALFAMAPGEVSEPVSVARGFVVARFVESRPGGAPPLEEIRARVEEDLRQEKAQERAADLARKAAAAGGEGDLKATGKKLGFVVSEAAAVTRGLAVGDLGVQPALEEAIFSAPVGAIQGPLELAGGPVVYQVTAREELDPEDLAERTPQVREELVAGRRQRLLGAVTRELSQAADVRYNTQLIQQIDNPAAAAPAAAPGAAR